MSYHTKTAILAVVVWIEFVALVLFAFFSPRAHADPDTTDCYENGQVNTYYEPHYCDNQFGPDYSGGNHRWTDGSDE